MSKTKVTNMMSGYTATLSDTRFLPEGGGAIMVVINDKTYTIIDGALSAYLERLEEMKAEVKRAYKHE